MPLQYKTFSSKPMDNNIILVYDPEQKSGILFDPSFDSVVVNDFIESEGIRIEMILFTHGHFDHFAGLSFVLSKINPAPKIGLHKDDLNLWIEGGGSKHFRIPIDVPDDPDLLLENGQKIHLGKDFIEVRHTPGHSKGSVIFYIPALELVITGDLIFYQGVGRTDLDGGDLPQLIASIQTQVYSLPGNTRIIPGHGPQTSVAEEMANNPFVPI